MPSGVTSVECAACGAPRPQPPAGSDEPDPCPQCGCVNRFVKVEAHEVLELHVQTRIKAKALGERKAFIETTDGDSFSVKHEVWAQVRQVIDRRNNRYQKRVELPDGTVLRDVDAPLSEHRGHGSDRTQPKGHP